MASPKFTKFTARKCLDQFQQTLTTLSGMQINTEVAEEQKALTACESQYREGTVFAYRNLPPIVNRAQKKALETAIKVLDQRANTNRSDLARAKSEQSQEVSKASSRISGVESQASSKERSYSASGFHGCLIGVAVVVGGFFLLAYAVNNDKDRVLIGQILMVCFGALLVGLLWKPIMKFLTADIPASSIRSQLPELRQNLERVKEQSESRLAQQTAKLDADLERLKQNKERCQALLKSL